MTDKKIKKLMEKRDHLKEVLEESVSITMAHTLKRLLPKFQDAKKRLDAFPETQKSLLSVTVTNSKKDNSLTLVYQYNKLTVKKQNEPVGIMISDEGEVSISQGLYYLELLANFLRYDNLFTQVVKALDEYVKLRLKEVQQQLINETERYCDMISGLKGGVLEGSINK